MPEIHIGKAVAVRVIIYTTGDVRYAFAKNVDAVRRDFAMIYPENDFKAEEVDPASVPDNMEWYKHGIMWARRLDPRHVHYYCDSFILGSPR